MKFKKGMYTTLFNGITDAHNKLDEARKSLEYANEKFTEAMKILEDSHIKAEEIFINEE